MSGWLWRLFCFLVFNSQTIRAFSICTKTVLLMVGYDVGLVAEDVGLVGGECWIGF